MDKSIKRRSVAKSRRPSRSVSIQEILDAGGADKFAITKGIDTRKIKLSGRVRVSPLETHRLLAQLNKQK